MPRVSGAGCGLVVGPKAPCADLDAPSLAADADRRIVNVGSPAALGAPLGVADVVARHPGFAAKLTTGHGLPYALWGVIWAGPKGPVSCATQGPDRPLGR